MGAAKQPHRFSRGATFKPGVYPWRTGLTWMPSFATCQVESYIAVLRLRKERRDASSPPVVVCS